MTSAPPPPRRPPGPERPAWWAIALSGLVAAFGVVSAAAMPLRIDRLKTVDGLQSTVSDVTIADAAASLPQPFVVAACVALALWMTRIRTARRLRGDTVEGPEWAQWWGWFIPVGSLVLPYLAMRAITVTRAPRWLVLAWWLPFAIGGTLVAAAAALEVTAFTLNTGELVRPARLDVIVPVSWAAAACVVVSWVFLVALVRRVTAAEREDDAQLTVAPPAPAPAP